MVKKPSGSTDGSKKRKEKTPLIPVWKEKQLAQDIELSGKTRDEFNLAVVADAKAAVYGKAGSAERRAVQQKFDQLKRKDPKAYQRYLDKIGVEHGEGVKRELRLAEGSSSESSDSDSSSSESKIKTSTSKTEAEKQVKLVESKSSPSKLKSVLKKPVESKSKLESKSKPVESKSKLVESKSKPVESKPEVKPVESKSEVKPVESKPEVKQQVQQVESKPKPVESKPKPVESKPQTNSKPAKTVEIDEVDDSSDSSSTSSSSSGSTLESKRSPRKTTPVPPPELQRISLLPSTITTKVPPTIATIRPAVQQLPTEIQISRMSASLGSMSVTDPSSKVLEQVKILESPNFKMDGSEDHPYIVIVNKERPEANLGFEVSLVAGIEHRGYVRTAYHIRKVRKSLVVVEQRNWASSHLTSCPASTQTTCVTQEDDWEAIIPRDKYPSLSKRAVLIRGPSQNFWHKSSTRYHQDGFCDKTRQVHEVLEAKIAETVTRRYSWWLIVLPDGTELENHIMSDDAVHVKKVAMDLEETMKKYDEDDIEEEFTLVGMDVYWRIALKGGDMLRTPPRGTTKKKRFVVG